MTNREHDGFHFLDLILLICAAAVVLASLMIATRALAHGENGWMRKYVNSSGTSCCDETDTVAIPNEDAAGAVIGSDIIAPFPSGVQIITVNAIHATEDKQGRAMISRYGCLFKQFGG